MISLYCYAIPSQHYMREIDPVSSTLGRFPCPIQAKPKPGAAKNPFADQPNPFQAVAAPKPTINQLRTGGQVRNSFILQAYCI
jgi:hypothetical protein